MAKYVLAIDQGTTSTRAVVYNQAGESVGIASLELNQKYPKPGWVEHAPSEIWSSVASVVPQAMQSAGIRANEIAAIGLTNQRETALIWSREDGKPVGPAIVWQDRRTTDFCRHHHQEEAAIYQKTGLVLDPYFSATKWNWLLKEYDLYGRADSGKLLAGTVDSWLLWNLTSGQHHLTDVTNASRTLLLDVRNCRWDKDLCKFFSVPVGMLPEVKPSTADFGTTRGLDFLPDGIPITGVAGDQQAALFGQCGFAAGDAKCTYGTGAFFLVHSGDQLKLSENRLLASIAATTSEKLEYVLEGSVFVAGAAVQWLRDGLKLFASAPLVEALAEQSDLNQPILFVPGFVGLGAPHWVPEVRGTIFGLTRETTAADLGRAALEGVAFQIADLVEAAGVDTGRPITSLRVDGGMARNAWFLQAQADLLGLPVIQAMESEATALGAAYLAGLHVKFWPDKQALLNLPRKVQTFEPKLAPGERKRRMERWHKAVQAVIGFYCEETKTD